MEDSKDVKTDTNVEKTQTEETTKTYTQTDIDNSFNAGFKKAKNGWQKDEDYQAFVEWKKTNQTDSEKMTNLENSNNELTKENNYLKAQIEVNNSGVKKEFSKFVTSEVINLVNETTDLETALTNYKKDNPQYFGETVVKKVQTSPNLTGGNSQPQTTNSIMNNVIRGSIN